MGNYGIGTYQSIANGVQVGSGFPTAPMTLTHPYAGSYGGTYGYLLDTTIKAPGSVSWTPAPEIGIDGIGNSIIRGFPQMAWNYPIMRPDHWYKINFLHDLSAKAPPGFQYIVLIQFLDIKGSGALAQQLARWDPITASTRTMAAFYGVQLKFSYIGSAALVAGTPVSVLS